jgi:hypothetical protein
MTHLVLGPLRSFPAPLAGFYFASGALCGVSDSYHIAVFLSIVLIRKMHKFAAFLLFWGKSA